MGLLAFDEGRQSARPAPLESMRRNNAHLSDEALVALVARSSDAALGELYDRYGSTAYGLALRVVRDAALAEDVVQEAFLSRLALGGAFRARAGQGKYLDHDLRAPARGRRRPARRAPPR